MAGMAATEAMPQEPAWTAATPTPPVGRTPPPQEEEGWGSKIWGGVKKYGPYLANLGAAGLAGASTGDPRAGIPFHRDNKRMLRESRLVEALGELDPRDPEQLEEAVTVLLSLGETEMAMKLLDQIQRGQIASDRAAQKAPSNRTIREGDETVNQQYNPETGEYFETGRGKVGSGVTVNVGDKAEQQGFENEVVMQKIYQKASAEWEIISTQHTKLQAAYELWKGQGGGTASADTNPQVYQVMGMILSKMLDPTSVVRDSEFARTEGFQSAIQRAEGMYNKWLTGSVSPELIEQVREIGDVLAQASAESQKEKWDSFRAHAKKRGLDPDFVTLGGRDPYARQAKSGQQAGGVAGDVTAEQIDAALSALGIENPTAKQVDAIIDMLEGR
jgi:hypothetical protein